MPGPRLVELRAWRWHRRARIPRAADNGSRWTAAWLGRYRQPAHGWRRRGDVHRPGARAAHGPDQERAAQPARQEAGCAWKAAFQGQTWSSATRRSPWAL